MRPLINDATSALLRAICTRIERIERIVFEEIVSRQWASATFTGARHDLTFRLEGPNAWSVADSFLDNLESAEFALRGHILADIALVSEERFADPAGEPRARLRIEALTVEDA